MQNPHDTHLIVVKGIFCYLKGTLNLGLHFTKTPLNALHAYCDADCASYWDDRRSTTDFAIFLGDNLLFWATKKQTMVSKSTAKAEYCALVATMAELMCFRNLLTNLGCSITSRVLYCDNLSAISMANVGIGYSITHIVSTWVKKLLFNSPPLPLNF